MTDAQIAAAMMELMIKALPNDDRDNVISCVQDIRSVIAQYGDHGSLALSYLAAVMAAEE